ILHSAASTESIAQLAMGGFEENVGGYRGYRVGIDLSIWLGHMQSLSRKPQNGKNAGIRLLFFRCARLLAMPILPVFVFDGLQRPAYKRGKDRKYSLPNSENLYALIEAFGFECHQAPGEAEAELAYLNNIGAIDAIWMDASDVFVFGALTILRSCASDTLSSNRSHLVVTSEGKQDDNHVHVYCSTDLLVGSIQLDRNGLILIALLRGGDYHKVNQPISYISDCIDACLQGVNGVGIKIAHALARCGFGLSLATAVQSLQHDEFSNALTQWRSEIVQELYTDSRGQLGRRHQKLAANFPQDFPDLQIYRAYAQPITSGSNGDAVRITWYRPFDLAALAGLCEHYFNWAGRDELLERFRSQIWHGALCRALRQSILEADGAGALIQPSAPGLGNLVVQIHGSRTHSSTDKLRELSVEIAPSQLADIARRGTLGTRIPSPDTTQARAATEHLRPMPSSPLRVWIPAALLRAALPELVREFEDIEGDKQHQKGKKRAARNDSSDSSASDSDMPPRKAARMTSPAGQHIQQQPGASSSGIASSSKISTQVIEISSSEDEMSGTAGVVIEISSSEDDTPVTRASAGGRAGQGLALSDDVIVIPSSDEE
ncbi:PIN domain-like protein, partial [Auricularia subglabra TFB-10046 SS5]